MLTNMNLGQFYGDFINQFPWDWYCTLTFKEKVSQRTSFKLFNRWKVELKKATNRRVEYVLIIESTGLRQGVPHLHLLLNGAENEKPYIWEQRWYVIGGLAKIKPYDSELGASYYLGYKMAIGIADVVFSRGLLGIAKENNLAVPKKY